MKLEWNRFSAEIFQDLSANNLISLFKIDVLEDPVVYIHELII